METVFDLGRRSGVRASGWCSTAKAMRQCCPPTALGGVFGAAGAAGNRGLHRQKADSSSNEISLHIYWCNTGARARLALAINTTFYTAYTGPPSTARNTISPKSGRHASSFHFASRPLRPAAFHARGPRPDYKTPVAYHILLLLLLSSGIYGYYIIHVSRCFFFFKRCGRSHVRSQSATTAFVHINIG